MTKPRGAYIKEILDATRKHQQRIGPLKDRIVKENGTEPTITFYYYSNNPIEYAGAQQVRESIRSLHKQTNVVIGDYSSDDGSLDLFEQFNVKVVNVPKTPNVWFHSSKIANKIMFECKSNFMVYANFNITYPKGIEIVIKRWLARNDIKRKILKLQGDIFINEKGRKTTGAPATQTYVIYRPFIIHARGYDERTSYRKGTSEYTIFLLNYIYKLKTVTQRFPMIHRYHTHESRLKYLTDKGHGGKDWQYSYRLVSDLYKEMGRSKQLFSTVKNSYW